MKYFHATAISPITIVATASTHKPPPDDFFLTFHFW
jgi:hypothetical protein